MTGGSTVHKVPDFTRNTLHCSQYNHNTITGLDIATNTVAFATYLSYLRLEKRE